MTIPFTNHPSRRTGFLKLLPGLAIWHMPFRFHIANALGPQYSLRCVLFHDVSDHRSPFTDGLGVTRTKSAFEERMRFLARYYTPVSLQEIFNESASFTSSPRPVLVTFDDAYASVALVAAPICQKYGIPALFFVNARFLDNRLLALDNLVCYVANTLGLRAINAVAHSVVNSEITELRSVPQILGEFLPLLSLKERSAFYERLEESAGIQSPALAREAGLYLSSVQLRSLIKSGFEIGNHTYSHVYGRMLTANDFCEEVDRNKAVLEFATGKEVRAFSVPYGHTEDLPNKLVDHLWRSGHKALFLVEGLSNPASIDFRRVYRVSVQSRSNAQFFSELEVMPRVRSIRQFLLRKGSSGVH